MVLIVPNANSNVQGGKARPGLRIGGVVAACVGAAGLVACRPDKYVNDIRRASRSKSDTKRLFPLQLSETVIDCISGGLGEAAALVALFPLDTLKVQCQARSISIRVAMCQILMQGPLAGIKSMYAGVGTAAIGAAVVGAVHLSVYRYWTRVEQSVMDKSSHPGFSPAFAVFGAVMSSLTVGALEAPLDQVKLRTQAKTISGSPLANLIQSFTSQGARQMFNSSFVPFVLKAIPHDVGEFVTFGMLSEAKQVDTILHPIQKNAKDALIGAISGIVAAVLSTPFEVVCTKVQTSPAKPHPTLQSSLAEFRNVARTELARGGVRSLYVGFVPRLLHMVPASVIYWIVVEEARRNLTAVSQ